MKKKCLAIMMASLLTFSVVGLANAADDKQLSEIMKPEKVAGPHPVTMEEWTNIIRSLQNERPDSIPDKPFRFRLKQQGLVEL